MAFKFECQTDHNFGLVQLVLAPTKWALTIVPSATSIFQAGIQLGQKGKQSLKFLRLTEGKRKSQ
ncbi:MAG: hypothetical protein OXC02_11240 [Rhodobacteraceae bacterium]|nr:hypothetical protein [Paracoccaceae bacterium]